MLRHGCLSLWIAVVLCACGAQPQQEAQQSSTGPAHFPISSPPSSSSVLKENGCTVDMMKVCQAFIDQPEFPLSGQKLTWERFAAGSAPHTEIELPANVLGDATEGTARCQVSVHARKISDGKLLPSGPSIAKTMEYFKQNGWCAEASPDYDKLMADRLQKIAANL